MKVVHCKKEKYDVYIGRPSKFGNPFVIGKDGTREEVIEKYRHWITTQPKLLGSLHELKDKVLGCWCDSDLACHGHVLIELVKKLNKSDKIKLSASKIKTLQNCSWLYYAQYILKLPQTTNSGAARGLCVHIVLECLIKPRHKKHVEQILNQTIPVAVLKLVDKHARKLGVSDKENLVMIYDMLITAIKNDFYCKGAVNLVAEEEFRFETDKYLINGFTDKTAVFPNGEVVIYDYKSSKSKFSNDELESNMQALMYSLACFKQRKKIPKIRFLFLRFPKQPLQEVVKCSEGQLRGFERFLEQVSVNLLQFNEGTAMTDLATDDITRKWLCGREGFKKDRTKAFICQYRKPFKYYALLDSIGAVLTSSFEKDKLSPKDGQKIEVKYYTGCPAFNNNKVTYKSELDDEDPFNF